MILDVPGTTTKDGDWRRRRDGEGIERNKYSERKERGSEELTI